MGPKARALLALGCAVVFELFARPRPASSGAGEEVLRPDAAVFQTRTWYNLDAAFAWDPFPLRGKVAIVTGSSSGIGRAAAAKLYSMGCEVVITSRSLTRSERAAEQIRAAVAARVEGDFPGTLEPVAFDLSDLDAVRGFAQQFLRTHDRLDFLSTNAGMPGLFPGYPGPWQSKQGYEILYAGNYLGHFYLVQQLLGMLGSSHGRVVATSSIAHWAHGLDLDSLLPAANRGRSDESQWLPQRMQQYSNTKLLQVCMCFEMQRRHPDVPCTPTAPGLVNTAAMKTQILAERDGVDGWIPVVGVDAATGAQTTLHALLAEAPVPVGVFLQPYWSPLHLSYPWLHGLSVMTWEILAQKLTWGVYEWVAHVDAYNATFARQLWEESVKAVQEFENAST